MSGNRVGFWKERKCLQLYEAALKHKVQTTFVGKTYWLVAIIFKCLEGEGPGSSY